jgi:ubiquinol-cytochrome c reductase subunit 7
LLNNSDPKVGEALELSDPAVRVGRQRRLKRASDLSFKGKNLQDYAPNMKLEPFKEEIWDDIQKIKARDAEFALLNAHKL